MDFSLNQITDQILNAVLAGLKAPNNFAISREQIKDEVGQARIRDLESRLSAGFVELEGYYQTIEKLALTKEDFGAVSGYTARKEFRATIIELAHIAGIQPIKFASAMTLDKPMKVIYGNDIFFALKDRYTGKKPTVWIQDTYLWLLNPPVSNIQSLKLRALFSNPRALVSIPGSNYTDNKPYPMPASAIDAVRNKLVNEYIRQYRMGNLVPTLLAQDAILSPQTK